MSEEGPPIHREIAVHRALRAESHMSNCDLCEFMCFVDRTRRQAGKCHCDSTPRVFQERIDWAGEQELSPTLVVNLSGCNMKCSFCITGKESQDGNAGKPLDLKALASRIQNSASGLASFTIEGGEPSIHLPACLDIAARVPAELPLVWKTNAYASARGLELLEGVIDVMLADYKFGNDACALRIGGIPRYTTAVRRNLKWGQEHSKLIIRHLLMPGHFECCFLPVVRWLAEAMPAAGFSLMTGFLPAWNAAKHPELRGITAPADVYRARNECARLGLNLVPWAISQSTASQQQDEAGITDEVWIDRHGRICVGFASAAMSDCLKRLAPELGLGI